MLKRNRAIFCTHNYLIRAWTIAGIFHLFVQLCRKLLHLRSLLSRTCQTSLFLTHIQSYLDEIFNGHPRTQFMWMILDVLFIEVPSVSCTHNSPDIRENASDICKMYMEIPSISRVKSPEPRTLELEHAKCTKSLSTAKPLWNRYIEMQEQDCTIKDPEHTHVSHLRRVT